MKIAVVGAGISGLAAAYDLAKNGVAVTLYEKECYLGGHAHIITIDGGGRLDLGFMVFNMVTYPNMLEMFEELGVEMEASDMSFSFSMSLDDGKGCEWGSRRGLASLFAQKSNALRPSFWRMMREILKFKGDVTKYLEEHENNPDLDRCETLEQFIKSHRYSHLFQTAYLVPICASIWSCSWEVVMSFSAFAILSFCRNHHLLELFNRPQWLTVKWCFQQYVNKVREQLDERGCQIKTGITVQMVLSSNRGCTVFAEDGSQEEYDGCIISVHAQDALRILGTQSNYDERRILGAFCYAYSDIYLHHDVKFMPKSYTAWSAWNFLGTSKSGVCLTYWLNVLQNLGSTNLPFLVTLNPPSIPKNNIFKWSTCHPIPSVGAVKASVELDRIQGMRRIWFCGAYLGYGFHEDGLKAGLAASCSVLGKQCKLLNNPKHMVPSLMEAGARRIVNKFLDQYILTGRITFLEEGGSIFSFQGTCAESCMKATLKVHSPLFYWKIATEADLGLAGSYINGYISFTDKEGGLLDFLMILVANSDLINSSRKNSIRGWWTPPLLTAGVASGIYFFRHTSRYNSLKKARRNISLHYDLGNDFFSLFLDETMTYSCAIFKSEDEDLQIAQLRKISHLIEKARIDGGHEVLEIGCGWGTFAIELVKKTGCKYTGITLSEKQLQYANQRAKKAGLEDHITFLLVDYRKLPYSHKYDRIISCEMIEEVGHEYMEDFFSCCDSLLAEDGLFVLQFIFIPDERYDEYRRSSDFIKEYIFPGGCIPCLSRITKAMASASRFCVEHLENIGIHYYQTLRYWMRNFLLNQSKILALGFDDKFIRTWEYYFMYCAAAFRSRTLGDYQIVFSRPRNLKALADPYKEFPSVWPLSPR